MIYSMIFYSAVLTTDSLIFGKDIHKIIMSAVDNSDLDKLSPRADAQILFRVIDSYKVPGKTPTMFCTKILVQTADHISLSSSDKISFTKIDVPENGKSFDCMMSALHTPMVDLSDGQKQALEHMGVSPIPKKRSTRKKVAFIDDKDFIASKIQDMFMRKGLVVENIVLYPSPDSHSDFVFYHRFSSRKSLPVVSFSVDFDYANSSKESVEKVLCQGVGKGKNYGLGMLVPKIK